MALLDYFDLIDEDRSGQIDAAELAKAMNDVGKVHWKAAIDKS